MFGLFELPVEDLVFVLCTVIGGGLLLITVLVDDILGGFLDALHLDFDIGGMSLMPLALSFISMFGVGGLFATQILDLHGGPAAVVGAFSGTFAAGIAYVLFTALRRSEAADPFSMSDLAGREAIVSVSIRANGWGSILIRAEGQRHEISATAPVEIPSGTPVRVTSAIGTGVSVEAIAPPAPTTPGPDPADRPAG
ncbi:MAG: hypothetical protein KF809_03980 [Chloroflexi bacterium]|nr:hypothetical protein [Chloroflexota bacterium]